MNWLFRLFRSSIGCKGIMALTGIALFGFVIAHLSGNLLIFGGPDAMNAYAVSLRELGPLLWVMRLGLLATVLVHIGAAMRLTRQNTDARPVPYVRRQNVASTAASRSMMMTGLTVAAYTVFHLAHLTWGFILHDFATAVDDQGRHDVYYMVVKGFQQWWMVFLYVVAMVILAVHLRHGISSFFQTLGFNHPRWNPILEKSGIGVATLIFLGYVSIPATVFFGLVGLDGGGS